MKLKQIVTIALLAVAAFKLSAACEEEVECVSQASALQVNTTCPSCQMVWVQGLNAFCIDGAAICETINHDPTVTVPVTIYSGSCASGSCSFDTTNNTAWEFSQSLSTGTCPE